MKARHHLTGALLIYACVVAAGAAIASPTDRGPVERGRYPTTIAGCNDCLRPACTENEGKVDESHDRRQPRRAQFLRYDLPA